MNKILDTVLLLALPASGKSEVRKYLADLSPEVRENDLHLGTTVQLDDFPYVYMMRRIDEELVKFFHSGDSPVKSAKDWDTLNHLIAGMRSVDDKMAELEKSRIFFHSGDSPFKSTKDWGTLINLINEDYADLVAKNISRPASAARHLFERLDRASLKAGEKARLAFLDESVRSVLAKALEKEAGRLLNEKHANYPETLKGKTLVIEFARGGPDGASMPLSAQLGYRYSIGELSSEILEKARILYIWVTPEESRRKNTARTDPDDPGSILHHGVPMEVMFKDYGCDDMDWLQSHAEVKGTVTILAHNEKFNIPIARFDNRVDKTSFIRENKGEWKPGDVKTVHEELKSALDKLAAF
ncbi:MAG: hypothetical protein A2X34_03295 [Elusimicrobia bacterium GWC2_51_8]|nr:MAG: hypothetical protein A2X33_06230 [Elusimicrobia bacterium GWA2_51_34]OGR64537.1 MAG: hypothetical protein A2X34_03295 [Elusimicrobia bacterium GWC2_51_8]OGR85226.1 MAG: hypothetical protein A2021_00595 [Elusimicrobia bacterium GWF2_52_66]HAF94734.1 hypothetical protein [Elusimicrobiota bacterium]HCE97656.1 hypothetical protein [Elusimicrobiota bacterium]